ncbi:hypothetical protein BJ508DRAFT_90176 [Ascobolus immersus RN42]|uniref:Uncharacterized protein n=1 Tax=Ascobolus immersus RN42 TaxID=1160509 RepID=A0A3N4HAB9_ASCIM|nr:hypothetical protein BJ508DRAFT_90176 [Ascobolus immersus RN42]
MASPVPLQDKLETTSKSNNAEPDYLDLLFTYISSLSPDGFIDLSTSKDPYVNTHFTSLSTALSSILLTSPRWSHLIHRASTDFPTLVPLPFRQILAEHLLFYYTHLHDFLAVTAVEPWVEVKGLDMAAMESIYAYTHLPVIAPAFVQRYKRGLMREGQIQLIKAAFKSGLEELKVILRIREPGFDATEEVLEACQRNGRLLTWLTSGDFRSERLEVLLGRYLIEPGVNLEVARAIERATDDAVCGQAKKLKDIDGWEERYRHILLISLWDE